MTRRWMRSDEELRKVFQAILDIPEMETIDILATYEALGDSSIVEDEASIEEREDEIQRKIAAIFESESCTVEEIIRLGELAPEFWADAKNRITQQN